MKLHNLVIIFLLLSVFTTDLRSAIIYVDMNKVTGANNGSCWNDAFLNLQSAIDAATMNDTIWVAAGTYYPTKMVGGTGNRYKTFELKTGVKIYGGFTGVETSLGSRDIKNNITVLSGDIGTAVINWNDFISAGWNDNVQHVIYAFSNGTLWTESAILDGFIVKGGYASGAGTNFGGGIYVFNGAFVEIKNSTFINNYAEYFGGAIANYQKGKIIVDNCLITSNKGTLETGGVWNEVDATAIVNNCEFSYNVGQNSSAMLNLGNSTATVINCKFHNNTSLCLGTFLNYSNATAQLKNCLFYDNTNTSTPGGTITNYYNCTLTASNVTVIQNSSVQGGGFYDYNSSTNINNSIIYNNTGNTGKQIYNSGGNITLNYCCYSNGTDDLYGTIGTANNNTTVAPTFVDVLSKDFRVYGNSVGIDAGNDSYNDELYDIRGAGFERKLNKTDGNVGTIDMGAFEYKRNMDPYCYGINPTNGGEIDGVQTLCPSGEINILSNINLPSGQNGTLVYKWQMSNESSTSGFIDILDSNSESLQPSSIIQTTWFKRLAIVECSLNWSGAAESNVIQISVEDNTAPVTPDLEDVTGECSVTVTNIPTTTDNCSGTVTGTTTDPIEFNEQGNYTITWTFDDGNGNSIDIVQNVIVEDITNPTISCIDNQTIQLSEGETSYLVSGTEFDPIEINENCEGYTVTNNFNQSNTLAGVEFPIGTTNLVWIVKDVNLNQAECNINVQVNTFVDVESVFQTNVSIHPNPTEGIIIIESVEANIQKIIISNVTGGVLVEKTNINQIETIDMTSFVNGVYLITLYSDLEIFNMKIIKK